jgi:hypothetical protein
MSADGGELKERGKIVAVELLALVLLTRIDVLSLAENRAGGGSRNNSPVPLIPARGRPALLLSG